MDIKKVTDIFAVDSDGNRIDEGITYAFDIEDGKCLVGVYAGLSKRNALMFKSVVSGEKVTFNVMPNSIVKIKKVVIG